MVADRYGNYEAMYLEKIKPQIRKAPEGQISGFGIKAISLDNNPKSFKWWPEDWT